MLFKNEDHLKFLSFVYNNQPFVYELFHFLVDEFNKKEADYLKNDLVFDESEYQFLFSNKDFKYIFDKSLLTKEDKFSKNNSVLNIDKKLTFNKFKEAISYLIRKEEDNVLILDEFKLQEFIRINMSDLTLENPFFRTESLKSKLVSFVNKEISNNHNQSSFEKEFFYLVKEASFSNMHIKDFRKRNSSKINEFILKNKQFIPINKIEIKNFIKNMYEELEQIIKDITIISESLDKKVLNILKIVDIIDSIHTKKNIINKYLISSMKTIKQFYQRDSFDTIQDYISNIFNVIDICLTVIKDENITISDFIKRRDVIRELYIRNLEQLRKNISQLTKKIKEKEEGLIFEEKMFEFFKGTISSDYDTEQRKKERQDILNIELLNLRESSNEGFTFKSKNIFDLKYKESDLMELLISNLNNDYESVELKYSDEEYEELIFQKNKEKEKLEKELQEKENIKKIKKEIISILSNKVYDQVICEEKDFYKRVDILIDEIGNNWASDIFLKELCDLSREFGIELRRTETFSVLTNVIKRKVIQ